MIRLRLHHCDTKRHIKNGRKTPDKLVGGMSGKGVSGAQREREMMRNDLRESEVEELTSKGLLCKGGVRKHR